MKAFSSKPGRQGGAIRFLLSILLLMGVALSSRGEVLLSCTGLPGGDRYDRGFYIPSFPGNSLDSARLVLSSFDAGDYTVTLTARQTSFNGAILGSSTVSFTLAGAYPQNRATTFTFPSIRITEGSRVCFIISLRASPAGDLYYSVPDFASGCTSVIETEGTTPPLSTFRRNGVNLLINGQDTLIVAPGETIQAAIDAASVGDTVRVDPGTYTENLRLRSGVNVVGSGYSSTILRGLGNTNVVTSTDVTNSRFEGFKITRNGNNDNNGVIINGGSLLLNNNWITGNRNGVRVNGGSPIIRNNIIDQNGSAADAFLNYGIISLSATPLIANNLVVSTSSSEADGEAKTYV